MSKTSDFFFPVPPVWRDEDDDAPVPYVKPEPIILPGGIVKGSVEEARQIRLKLAAEADAIEANEPTDLTLEQEGA